MALSHVQTKGATTGSVTLDATPTEGNLLVALGTRFSSSTALTWPADWIEASAGTYNVGGNRRFEVRYRVAGADEATSISITGGTDELTLSVSEYGGGTWTAPYDTGSVTTGSTNPLNAPSITPTSGREAVIVIGYSCWDGARSTTWPGGFTQRYAGSVDGENSMAWASSLVASTSGSYNGSVSGTSIWGQVIGTFAFIADAGGGGGGGSRSFAVIIG